MMQINLEKQLQKTAFSFVKKILKIKGAEIYLVGGAVRDSFLNISSKDYDFIIRGLEAEKIESILKKIGSVNLVGKTFGVFKFIPNNKGLKIKDKELSLFEPFDIALPRIEHSLAMQGGYKDFSIQSDKNLPIEDDLQRRDFTINAIALKLVVKGEKIKINETIDPTFGISDLENKIIRAVGKPEIRFKEDYSRILRALRFACQLDFEFDKETSDKIEKMAHHLNDKNRGEWVVPRETIGKEIVKMFVLNPVKAFDNFEKNKLFEILIPEMLKSINCPQPQNWHTEGDVYKHTRLAMQKIKSQEFIKEFPDLQKDAEVVFGTLFHDIGKPYTIQTPERDGTDRIRFSEHEAVGAKLTREIVERLKMSSFSKDSNYHIDVENLYWIIDKHLIPVKERVDEMKKTTFEKYFFSSRYPSQKLLAVSLLDALATIPTNGIADTSNYYHVKEKMAQMAESSTEKIKPPKQILSGFDVMKALGLKPGPEIGGLLELIREEQLNKKIKTKKQALDFIKKIKTSK